MLDFENKSELDRAKYLLPLHLLQLPAIFEDYTQQLGFDYLYQILPMPEDFYKSKIKGLGTSKIALMKRSLDAVGLPFDEEIDIPSGIDVAEEQQRLKALQESFLTSDFQPQIFPSIGQIRDLGTELAANLDMVVSAPGARSPDVERKILLAYWGWDGQHPRTLDEVGQLGLSGKVVSRQRIEQSDKRAKSRLESFLPYTDHLQEAVKVLKGLAPIRIAEASKALENAGITLSPLKIDGLLNAAEILLGGHDINIDRASNVIFPSDDTDWFYNLIRAIGPMVESNGACRLESLLEFENLTSNQSKFVRNFIDMSDNYFWLDDNKKWVFTRRKRNRVENALQKIFSVTDSIAVDICVEQVNKDPRVKLEWKADILSSLATHFDFVENYDGLLHRTYPVNVPFGGAERAFLTQMTTQAADYNAGKIEAYAATMSPPVTSPLQVLYRSPIARNIGYNEWVLIGDKWKDTGIAEFGDVDLPGRQEAIDRCLDQMWRNAFGAAGQSGKTVQSVRKYKLIGFTEEEFKLYCEELMRTEMYLCKLTSLPLDIYCHNRDYMPSADRIDSDKGYERGNIQIICSFANSWKSNRDNDEFLSLLADVRKIKN